MKGKKFVRIFSIILLVMAGIIISLFFISPVVHAAGLVDDTMDEGNLYSRYALENYQLDFYVDKSWGWLPWNWGDSIGKNVMYALYSLSNVIWTISLYISNATGYVVQEAFRLDFINDMADSIGENMQILAGVSRNGFSTEGFYVGLLPLIILAVGVYVAYTGLIKHETSKAFHAVASFLLIFLLTAGFIAYAPDYIKKVNDFSKDMSTTALELGTKIVLPDSGGGGSDSVDMIRNNLFSIQVQQPWLLLQYGTTDIDSIGSDRVEGLLSVSPSSQNGKDREEVVKAEVNDRNNSYMTITKVSSRLGTVLFLFVINFIISVFVLLFSGIMLFSQVLFIIYALFLPVSFLVSMIPSYDSTLRKSVEKVFNVILMRTGITLVVTVAFCISSMFYSLSSGYPFFLTGFLQIVTFVGIFVKQSDIMGMFSLQSNDAQQMGRRIVHRPYMFMRRHARRMEHRMGRSIRRAVAPGNRSSKSRRNNYTDKAGNSNGKNTARTASQKQYASTVGGRAGAVAGGVLDTGKRIQDKAQQIRGQVQDMPTQARYAVYKNASDFKRGLVEEAEYRQQMRAEERGQRREEAERKRKEMADAINHSSSGMKKESETEAKGNARPNIPTSPKTAAREDIPPEKGTERAEEKSAGKKNSANAGSSGTDRTFQRQLKETRSRENVNKVPEAGKSEQDSQNISDTAKGDRKPIAKQVRTENANAHERVNAVSMQKEKGKAKEKKTDNQMPGKAGMSVPVTIPKERPITKDSSIQEVSGKAAGKEYTIPRTMPRSLAEKTMESGNKLKAVRKAPDVSRQPIAYKTGQKTQELQKNQKNKNSTQDKKEGKE